MLSLLLLHIIITLISLFSGFLFYHFVLGNENDKINHKPVIVYLITGLISITIVCQLIELFAPINEYAQFLVLLLLAVLLGLTRKAFTAFLTHLRQTIRNQHTILILAIFSVWALILLLNTGPITMDDTESYHIQSIKWIKEYGTVPGLVHLHERFAFNTSWFSSIAFFNIRAGHLNYYTALNGTLSVWLAAYLITLITGKNKSIAITGFILLLISLAAWPLIRGNATTSNYDYITAVVLLVLFIETISLQDARSKPLLPAEWLIWPIYLFTVRIINFPFLLLPVLAFFFMAKQKEYKKILKYSCIGILLIIPFLTRNILLSGYLFYPSLSCDWFSFDWKADLQKTRELLHFIKYYNRVSTGFLTLETTESMSFLQWTKAWIKYMYTYDKIIFLPAVAGLLSFPFIMKKISLLSSLSARIFMWAIFIQLITWFLTAPDPRFIYGCLLIGLFVLSMALSSHLNINYLLQLRSLILFFTFTICTGLIISKLIKTNLAVGLLLPVELPSPQIKTISLGDIKLYIPEKILHNWNPRCFDTPLPCLYEVDPRLRLRKNTIQDGFRLSPE